MKRLTYALFFLLIGLVAFQSCSNEGETLSESAALGPSGEELFRGIFLMDGDVAQQIKSYEAVNAHLEDLKAKDAQLAGQFAEANDKLVRGVQELSPTYFDDLQKAISSKQFNDIEEELEKGALLVVIASIPHYFEQADLAEVEAALATIDISAYDFTVQSDLQDYLKAAHGSLKELSTASAKYLNSDDGVQGMVVPQDVDRDIFLILPFPVLPQPVLPTPVLPQPVLPQPVLPQPVLPWPVLPQPVIPQPVIPQPVIPQPVIPQPVLPLIVPLPPVIGQSILNLEFDENGETMMLEQGLAKENFIKEVALGIK